MMGKDLVLKPGGKWGWENVATILPNIPRQRYVIGSVYPGEKEGEAFMFCRNYKGYPVAPIQCAISVNEGQYWIEDCTDQSNANATFKTFLNSEIVKAGEKLLLKSGDVVSLRDPSAAGPPCHVFHVKERLIPCSDLQNDENLMNDLLDDPNSPLVNDLILEKIMSYLPIRDLKEARLVSKKWKAEASKPLEKRCKVSFTFDDDYLNPNRSTRVFHYLHEMRDMKIQKLHICFHPTESYVKQFSEYKQQSNPLLSISPGKSGDKIMDDLRKLLKSSQSLSTLSLKCEGLNESEFSFVHILLQELGGKLVELKLDLNNSFFPAVLPPLPVMTNLKKFVHTGYSLSDDMKKRWVSQFAPLLPKNLEHLTGSNNMATLYLEEFLKEGTRTPNLKGIGTSGTSANSRKSLLLLLELKSPLTSLQVCNDSEEEEDYRLLERLLWKHSKSLQTLQIQIGDYSSERKITEVKFPSFPKLEELGLEYISETKVSWETNLDYEEHFPSLRKLTVLPSCGLYFHIDDDPVFHAFFPEETPEVRCETVKDLRVSPLQHDEYKEGITSSPTEYLQQRMGRIKGLFPNAVNTDFS